MEAAAEGQLVIVIPAYRPGAVLWEVAAVLAEQGRPVVVVDDGSGAEFDEIFARVAALAGVRLARHAVNLGKGAALKTGINYALCAWPGLRGVVTADADGQHDPADIARVAEALAADPECLVLGARAFGRRVPARSRFGNLVTRGMMRVLAGQQLSDTQTGLRGIPAQLLPQLLKQESNGYEFELDMLILARRRSVRIREVAIRTIYEPGNRSSHFNPLVDSMKIYFVLLRFSSVSLTTALLDNLVFFIAYRHLGSIAAAQVLGRALAVAYNYSLVRRAVFFSRQRHAAVLPKYLLLVAASGAASYAGIELLSSSAGIHPFSAKLLVETLMFFANFAIQRDFIFASPAGEGNGANGEALPAARWRPAHRAVLAALFAALVGVELYGFRASHVLSHPFWSAVGLERLVRFTWMFGAAAAIVLVLAPWAFAGLAAALVAVCTLVAVGPAPPLAVALFLTASYAMGTLWLGRTKQHAPLAATLLGVATYVFVMTFLVRVRANYAPVYLLLLAAPIAARPRAAARQVASVLALPFRVRLGTWAERGAAGLFVFVMAMHWLIVLAPETSSDGLAMHMAIADNLRAHHLFTYTPDRFVWAVMPMGADWCYAMVYMLGGEFGARLLNLSLLLVLAALLYRAGRRWAGPAVSLLVVCLFVSSPMVEFVTGSLLVENLLAALLFGAVAALWRFGDTGEKVFLYAAGALAGTAMAVKLAALPFAVAAACFAAVEVRRRWKLLGRRPALACAAAVVLLAAAAAPTYVLAYVRTGNPVFPFLNQRFPSPYLDGGVDLRDARFREPLTPATPFDLTFHTGRYYEGLDGSFGFQYLVLAPLGLAAALLLRQRAAIGAAAIALGAGVLIFRAEPNARYLYAALPLLLVPAACLLGSLGRGRLRGALVGFAAACVPLNAYFLTSSDQYHHDFYVASPLSKAGRAKYLRKAAPFREVIDHFERAHAGAPVLLAQGGNIMGLTGDVYVSGWHDYNWWSRVEATRDAADLAQLLRRWSVQYVIAMHAGLGGADFAPPDIGDLLAQCGVVEYQAGGAYLARIAEGCPGTVAPRVEPVAVAAGKYDDFDPALAFAGRWERRRGMAGAYLDTTSACDEPGAAVRFAFQGGTLTYVHDDGPDRGLAAVLVDGTPRAVVDLYAPGREWRRRTVFQHLGPGRHVAEVRVLGERNPKAGGGGVDVDGFEVE